MLTLMPVAMTRGANLRGVFPVPARSHLIVQKAVMFELARRGHEVTVVSSSPENKANPNYTDIELKTSIKDLMGSAGKGVAGVYNRL
jgi:glucuronosyltransferase